MANSIDGSHSPLQASDSVFIVVASDGVWEFMKAEEAHKILNKKLRLVSWRSTSCGDTLLQAYTMGSRRVLGRLCEEKMGNG